VALLVFVLTVASIPAPTWLRAICCAALPVLSLYAAQTHEPSGPNFYVYGIFEPKIHAPSKDPARLAHEEGHILLRTPLQRWALLFVYCIVPLVKPELPIAIVAYLSYLTLDYVVMVTNEIAADTHSARLGYGKDLFRFLERLPRRSLVNTIRLEVLRGR
jgi:hypothetical protein